MIQLQVMNYLLDTKDSSFLTINNLDSKLFSDYKEEFTWLKNHYDKYGSIPDKETFAAQFPYFDFIVVNEPPKYLLDALYQDKNRRDLADTFNKIAKNLNENNTEKAMEIFQRATENIADNVPLASVDVFKDTSRYDKYVERTQDFSKYYVTTGFRELDDIIGGWDRTEELATIVARTNSGKSWLCIKCAIAAAETGLTVGIYSGEMSDMKVGYRIDTLISHISNTKIIHGNESIQNEYKRYIDSLHNGAIKGTIKVLTPSMINGPAGVTALRAFIEKDKLDMLVIDQHSLLEDDRKARNPVERASNISKDLKNLQVQVKIPIIAVSQQNRTQLEGRFDTVQIAQSDRIGQDSTIVIFFEQKDGVMNMSLVKSRDTANDKSLHYAINFDKGVFEYMPDDVASSDTQDMIDEYGEDTPF